MKIKTVFLLLNLFLFFQETVAQTVQDSIQQLLKIEKNEIKKTDLLHQLAQSFQRKSTDSVILYANKSLKIAKRSNYILGKANANKSLAWAYYHRSENEKSRASCLKAINYYKKIKDNGLHLSNCIRLLSGIYIEQNKYDDAIKNLLIAKNLIKKNSSKKNESITMILNDIAYLYLELDNYEMAMQYLNNAITAAKTNDNTTTLADSYNILATINSKEDDFTNAIKFYNSSKDIYTQKKDFLGIATCITNIGITYYRKGNYRKSIDFLEKAVKQNKVLKYNSGLLNSRIYLSKSYIKLNNLKKANALLAEAIKTAKELNLSFTEITIAQSELAIKKNQNAKAIKVIENYFTLKNTTLLPREKTELYKILSIVYEKNKNFKDALYTKKEYHRITDSINNKRKAMHVTVLQAEFDFKKIQNDLKESRLKLTISEEKNKASNLINTSLLVTGILLITIFALTLKRKREAWKKEKELYDSKQDSEIKYKNKQITDFALHISEKNELLTKIKNKIKQLANTEENDSKIAELLLFLNNNLEQNNVKVALYADADNSKDDFYQKLSKQYPNLTEKEKRVATLVRLDLSSKQIGIKLNITKASVNNYRYALRKKMNIPKNVFLYDVLKKI